MKTKIVYVVISAEKDLYFEQAFVSITSLRMKNKDRHVVLLTEKESNEFLQKKKYNFESIIDEKIVIGIDDKKYTNKQRSRWLKTNVRKYVNGDFLFIDTDTVILSSLSEIDLFQGEIGAVIDTHTSLESNPYKKMLVEDCKKLDYNPFKEKNYFNSGVLYVKDTNNTREFYRIWHTEWEKGVRKNVNMDQPSFNKANNNCGSLIEVMDGGWNCQLKHGVSFFMNIKILHYLVTNRGIGSLHYLMNDSIYERLKLTGRIDDETLSVIQDPIWNFNSPTEIVYGKNIDFKRTEIIRMLNSIYFKYRSLFSVINNIALLFYKIKK